MKTNYNCDNGGGDDSILFNPVHLLICFTTVIKTITAKQKTVQEIYCEIQNI
jgi:hypothetical protein